MWCTRGRCSRSAEERGGSSSPRDVAHRVHAALALRLAVQQQAPPEQAPRGRHARRARELEPHGGVEQQRLGEADLTQVREVVAKATLRARSLVRNSVRHPASS